MGKAVSDEAAAAAPPAASAATARRALSIQREDLRTVLDEHPAFRRFFWQHEKAARERLVEDWQGRYDDEALDCSGRTKALRLWAERCVDAGLFDGGGGGGSASTAAAPALAIGQEVEVRDRGERWRRGRVRSVHPLRVRPEGAAAGRNWCDAVWHEVRPVPFAVGQRVRVRDSAAAPWRGGVVRVSGAGGGCRVTLLGGDGAHAFGFVAALPVVRRVSVEAAGAVAGGDGGGGDPCGVCLQPLTAAESWRVCPEVRGHYFHRECLEKHVEETPCCPSCRCVDSDGEGDGEAVSPGAAAAAAETAGAVAARKDAALQVGDVVTVKGRAELGVVVSLAAHADAERAVRRAGEEAVGVAFSQQPEASAGEAVALRDVIGLRQPPVLGARLVICNLAGKEGSPLNGRVGTCVGYSGQRVVVLLEHTTDRASVRTGNVRLAAA